MRVTKYELSTFYKGELQYKTICDTKAEVFRRESTSVNKNFTTKYTGEVIVDLRCACCEKDLKHGDVYLKVDEDTRYCEDCYEENTVTYYTVGGDNVGDDNDAGVFDEWDREGEEVLDE